MTEYFLHRQPSTEYGTLGEIVDVENNHICYTCELPWLNNEPKTSCIPVGIYTCIPHDSVAHPNTWEISNVPDRTTILIHNGNAAEEDSLGCILVGSSFGLIDNYPAVLNSVTTLDILRKTWPPTFTLCITQ